MSLFKIYIITSISIFLIFNFYLNQHFTSSKEGYTFGELLKWLKDVRPLIVYGYDNEAKYTVNFFYIFLSLIAYIVFFRTYNLIKTRKAFSGRMKYLFSKSDVFLLISIVILFLYFKIPNHSHADMMSDRLILMFFIFLVVWLASQHYSKWINLSANIYLLSVYIGLLFFHLIAIKQQNHVVEQFVQIDSKIDDNSVVLPLDYSDNWLSNHFSNYLGVKKNLIILNNLEAQVGWYPIVWNKKKPLVLLGNHERKPDCLPFNDEYNFNPNHINIDYVAIYGGKGLIPQNNCKAEVMQIIQDEYDLIYISDDNFVRLYKLKPLVH